MTIWQQNAQNFASRPAERVDQERRRAVRTAFAMLRDGGPDWRSTAVNLLLDSVHRQHRWSASDMPAPEAPEATRSCFDCQHYALIASAGHCALYGEPILSEVAASRECEGYAP